MGVYGGKALRRKLMVMIGRTKPGELAVWDVLKAMQERVALIDYSPEGVCRYWVYVCQHEVCLVRVSL